MKELIVEYMPFSLSPEQINEATTNPGGKLIVRGVMQRAEARNQNNRIYPKAILQREAVKYTKNFIEQKRALGELDHPDSSVVNLNNVSHNVLEMKWVGNELHGVVEILPTPSGQTLAAILKSGVTVGISSRGVGSVKEIREEGASKPALLIQDDFELIAFDFVSNPSTHGAFMHQVSESVRKEAEQFNSINSMISEILCDLGKIF